MGKQNIDALYNRINIILLIEQIRGLSHVWFHPTCMSRINTL